MPNPAILAGRRRSVVEGHPGVALWVAANSADVLAYYPMDDAVGSGTLTDVENANNSTYGSSVTSVVSNGASAQDLAEFTGGTASRTAVTYGAWMNNQVALFLVVDADVLSGVRQLWGRDVSNSAHRAHQFRTNAAKLEFVQIAGGTVTISASGSLTTLTEYTVGWWWDGTTTRIYQDGVLVGSATASDPSQTSADLQIAYRTGAGGTGVEDFDGAIGSAVMLSAASASTIPDLHAAWRP